MKMSNWENMSVHIEDYLGFIYLITGPDGRKYIGKKTFWFERTRPPLKGRKNKRHYKVESDWKDYYGSSPELLEDVERLGKDKFRREILMLCNSKWELSYYEAKMQFDKEVLFDDGYYNGIINCRLRARKGKR